MPLSQPPKTGNQELDRWLFLFWKQVEGQATVAADAPSQPAFVVDVPHGGSGTSSLTGYVKGNGSSPLTAVLQIPATDISGLPTPVIYGPNIDALDQTVSAGMYAVTAYGSSAVRTMTGTANRISVTNGDGVSANPTFDISASYVGQNTITTLGTITTGVWNAGALTTSGALTVSGISSFAAGAVGAPSITRTGDLNTGLYFPNPDEIGISTGGVDAIRISATQDVDLYGSLAISNGGVDALGDVSSGGTLISTVAIGTAPLAVTSTTLVANLYVARAALADSATTNANLTGPITSTGNATAVASQTGTGSTFVMQASPTLTTPVIGAATGTSLSLSGAGSADTLSATTTITAGTTIQGAFMTATTASDAVFSCISTGTVQSARFQIVGRQSSVDNEWNIVAPGNGLAGTDLRFVSGGWTATPVATLSTAGDFAITGTMKFGTRTAIGAETVTGYITITDSGGTSRKLAVVS